MKQLKFMIAATAAIGLAGVAQAVSFSDVDADNGKDALSNTGFEDMALTAADASVTTGTDSYFLYTGDVAADNESKIIAGEATLANGVEKSNRAKGAKFVPAAGADAKVLEVNTGTDPLLRTLGAVENGDSSAVDLPDGGLYIDTLVQFTVTPAGDTVTPTADDKLMIYLQEVAPVMAEDGETVATPGATNLMVMAGYYNADGVIETKPYKLNNVDVEPGVWYRLTVRAYANITGDDKTVISGFTIGINGQDYNSATPVVDDIFYDDFADCNEGVETKLVFPSRITGDATLKAVGFAGEGKVDDIVFSTTLDADPDTLDFTFTWDANKITSVQYTIGGSSLTGTLNKSGTAIEDLDPNTKITIAVTPAAWYVYNGQTEFTVTTDFTETELSATLVDGDVEGSTAVDSFVDTASSATDAATALGVNNTAFTTEVVVDENTTVSAKDMLKKGLNWAKTYGKAPSYLNGVAFKADGTPDGKDAEAYLLNCDPTLGETAFQAIKDQFKFTSFSFDAEGNPVYGVADSWADGANEIDFNGRPEIHGATKIGAEADWAKDKAGAKFFKAFLVK